MLQDLERCKVFLGKFLIPPFCQYLHAIWSKIQIDVIAYFELNISMVTLQQTILYVFGHELSYL
ncbi:unnamed protein product [Spirodela intermedia]|uniref:Uncharacterized protein n=1 Tax=Spirodela intermedia TaxID=51605 RepID=A0A7I8JM42_SPIIN|nr:unnamed protein product [Spirodela intermedia]CAA6671170.1 unnamed protein product [Spirodela intermedia]